MVDKGMTDYVPPKHLDARFLEIKTESDTSSALVAAALVENALAHAIHEKLPRFNEAGGASDLFAQSGPYGTFSLKIKAAYAMGIFEAAAFADLNKIRKTRNEFAHSPTPLSFDASAISSRCRTLATPDRHFLYIYVTRQMEEVYAGREARGYYELTCQLLTSALYNPTGWNLHLLGFRWNPLEAGFNPVEREGDR